MGTISTKDLAERIARLLEYDPPRDGDKVVPVLKVRERVAFSDGRLAAFDAMLENGERFRIQVSRVER